MSIMIKVDSNARIIATPEDMVGKKRKYKVAIDDKLYIIKLGGINYEIYAELIAEMLGKQVGIEMAHYNICEFNGEIGLITPVFLNAKDGDLIISVKMILDIARSLCIENNIHFDLMKNSVDNILKAISLYDKRIDIDELAKELIKRWLFYGVIMESDKNNTNLSFIKNRQSSLRISPDYDNSTMARMNENINSFINYLSQGIDIFSLTDGIKTALTIENSSSDEFLVNYRQFIDEYGLFYRDIIETLTKIDVDKAIDDVEKENQMEIPWEVKFWLRKAITARKKDMIETFNNLLKKSSTLKL